jgi:hypothetical protein
MQHRHYLLINRDQIDDAVVQGSVGVCMHALYERS